jgi:hypothetical protein
MTIRILVTGSRDLANAYLVNATLDGVLDGLMYAKPDDTDIVLIHGGAKGADTLAANWAASKGIRCERYNAQWDAYGKAAGPMRNQQMVDTGADVVVGFLAEGSRGTADCLKRATKAGIPSVVIKV